ncbi:homoprotocatechuate degradation operon regulator HpaR [Tepidicella baoligensis]|uniref:homoprotocatechuate degradation operon regulator HpaR n=1 Tax=Tepidicella baoligensis TaxID=2707016 RepID=UPI0015D98212|nr:homoprotocatechuate degradation operon regulator HpaR [Tepidicella baoligensis]
MPASPFTHRNLPLLLLQAREAVFGRFRPILNEAGITEQQWRILRALLEHGALEPRQIGGICCLSSPSLAGILARMEDLDLIHRQRLPHDQRRVLVSASEQGTALAQRLAPRIEATYRELEETLGPAFTGEVYRLLDRLIQRLDLPVTPPAQPPAG